MLQLINLLAILNGFLGGLINTAIMQVLLTLRLHLNSKG